MVCGKRLSTVNCPSACLSVLSTAATACGKFAAELKHGQQILIDSCLHCIPAVSIAVGLCIYAHCMNTISGLMLLVNADADDCSYGMPQAANCKAATLRVKLVLSPCVYTVVSGMLHSRLF